MKTYTVNILERAVRDIIEIYGFIRMDNETAAEKIYSEIRTAINDLGASPFRGASIDKTDPAMIGYRFIMVKPYMIFYKVNGGIVTVYHVIDDKRDYMKILV